MEYQETMNLDIETIASKKQPFWRSIYEVIDDSYSEIVKLFPTTLLDQYRDFTNEYQQITSEVKAALKMAMEQGLYAQLVTIHQRESDNKKEKEKTNNITSRTIIKIKTLV